VIPAFVRWARSRSPARSSSLRCGKRQSFFADAIAPPTFLRKVPRTLAGRSSAGSSRRAEADLSRANSSPSGPLHPTRRAADLDHRWPKPPHPGPSSSWPQREGAQAARRQLRSNHRPNPASHDSSLFGPVRQPLRGDYNASDLGGGEGSAAKQPERRPRGQDRRGPHEAARCPSGWAPKR
jgi:hypothetical protein